MISLVDWYTKHSPNGLIKHHLIFPKLLTLEEVLPSMNLRQFFEFLFKFTKGLSFIHGAGITHGDIKIANILVDPLTRDPRIADFDLSFSSSVRLAHFQGTRGYVAPEVLNADDSNPVQGNKSDIWSAGITFARLLFHVLSKRSDDYFFDDWDCEDILEATNDRLPKSGLLEYELSAVRDFISLVARMVEFDAARRPTAEECCASLKSVSAATCFSPAPALSLSPPSPSSSLMSSSPMSNLE